MEARGQAGAAGPGSADSGGAQGKQAQPRGSVAGAKNTRGKMKGTAGSTFPERRFWAVSCSLERFAWP